MRLRSFRRQRAGLLVGALALALAITGTATAAKLIGSKQIRNNSVRSKDIRNGTVKPKDLSAAAKATLQGAKGDTGLQGPKGDEGPQGPAGPSNVLGTSDLTGDSWATMEPGDPIFRSTGLEAGKSYLVTVKTTLENETGADIIPTCQLGVGIGPEELFSPLDEVKGVVFPSGHRGLLVMHGFVKAGGDWPLIALCEVTDGEQLQAHDTVLTALEVGSVPTGD